MNFLLHQHQLDSLLQRYWYISQLVFLDSWFNDFKFQLRCRVIWQGWEWDWNLLVLAHLFQEISLLLLQCCCQWNCPWFHWNNFLCQIEVFGSFVFTIICVHVGQQLLQMLTRIFFYVFDCDTVATSIDCIWSMSIVSFWKTLLHLLITPSTSRRKQVVVIKTKDFIFLNHAPCFGCPIIFARCCFMIQRQY